MDHDGICRLCLSVDTQNMYTLRDDPAMLEEILFCFSISITSEDPYPKQICTKCKEKIYDIHNYRNVVATNNKLLNDYTAKSHNAINKFYLRLKYPDIAINADNESVNVIKDENLKLDVEFKSENDVTYTGNEKTNELIDANNIEDRGNYSPVNDTTDDDLTDNAQDCNEKDSKKSRNLTETIEDTQSLSNAENVTKFKCLTCFEFLDTKNQLLLHYNTKHKSKENVAKTKCERIKVEDGGFKYKCTECTKIFATKKSAINHYREHATGRSFICKICGRTYLTASEIVRHGRAHGGARLRCRYCAYATAYRGALAQHERRHAGDQTKFKCEECGKGFQVKTWYLQHQNVHKGLKPFVCDICGVAFHMDRYLTAHRSSVHPQTSSVKRYVCPHCSLPCDSRKAYTEHLKVHGIQSRYLCDICGKTLSNGEQLKFHKRVHLGVRPYCCRTCDKTFTKKFNLQLHERTHTGEKTHSCDICGKHYSQRSTLLRHNNRHHSIGKQSKCTRCEKVFPSSDTLATHQQKCL